MKLKLDKVIETLEFTNNEIEYYYNPDTEKIFISNIGEFEKLTEDELEELFEKSIMLPTRYDINEYKMIKNFVKTIDDTRIKNQLNTSLYGKGAFRNERYKEIAMN